MTRILFVLALLVTMAPTLASAQTYPWAETLKGLHPDVYAAAVSAHKVATEAEPRLARQIAEMRKAEAALRKALVEEDDFSRLANVVGTYVGSASLVEKTGDEIFDASIKVTIVADKHHAGDRDKMNVVVMWLQETQAFQRKIDVKLTRVDAKLLDSALKRHRELEAKAKK